LGPNSFELQAANDTVVTVPNLAGSGNVGTVLTFSMPSLLAVNDQVAVGVTDVVNVANFEFIFKRVGGPTGSVYDCAATNYFGPPIVNTPYSAGDVFTIYNDGITTYLYHNGSFTGCSAIVQQGSFMRAGANYMVSNASHKYTITNFSFTNTGPIGLGTGPTTITVDFQNPLIVSPTSFLLVSQNDRIKTTPDIYVQAGSLGSYFTWQIPAMTVGSQVDISLVDVTNAVAYRFVYYYTSVPVYLAEGVGTGPINSYNGTEVFAIWFDGSDVLYYVDGVNVYSEAITSGGPVATNAQAYFSIKNTQTFLVTNFIYGSSGTKGPEGVQGPQGLRGFQGFQGPQGPQGLRGFQGFQGPQGPQGPQGTRGASTWTPVLTANMSQSLSNSNLFTKSGTTGWNASVYSVQGYSRGLYVTIQPANTTTGFMVGFAETPGASSSFNDINYAFYFYGNTTPNQLRIYESNIDRGLLINNYTTSTVCTLTYDGANVRYFVDGTLYRTVARAIGAQLFLDSSFENNGGSALITYGPMGEQGPSGGPQGPQGLQGGTFIAVSDGATPVTITSANYANYFSYTAAFTVNITTTITSVATSGGFWVFRNNSNSFLTMTISYGVGVSATIVGVSGTTISIPAYSSVGLIWAGSAANKFYLM